MSCAEFLEVWFTHNTRCKKFSVKIKYKQGWACKKYRNKAGMKTQEDYPAGEKSW